MPKKTTGAKTVKELPSFDEQMKVLGSESKSFRDIISAIEAVLPPPNAALGSDELKNAQTEKWRKALEGLKSVYNRLTGRTNKDKETAAMNAEEARKSVVTALKGVRDAMADYDAQVAQMESDIGFANLKKLSSEKRAAIAAQINAEVAKLTPAKEQAEKAA